MKGGKGRCLVSGAGDFSKGGFTASCVSCVGGTGGRIGSLRAFVSGTGGFMGAGKTGCKCGCERGWGVKKLCRED